MIVAANLRQSSDVRAPFAQLADVAANVHAW
jgi:hypothetical protein